MDSIRNECVTSEAGPVVLEEQPLSPTVGSLPHQILEADETNDPTILDYLNEDCWRIVLDFLPFKDIVRSETVSQRWQGVVLTYLRRFRFWANHTFRNIYKNQRQVPMSLRWGWGYAASLFDKQGSSEAATSLHSVEELERCGETCPNLEAMLFYSIPEQLLLSNQSENFKRLQQICFKRCPATDRCDSEFIKSNVLKELIIEYNARRTDKCLFNITSLNLESLVLKRCPDLEPCLLADRFSELTKLELIGVPNEICKQLPMVLDKMPNLEHLRIIKYDWGFETFDEVIESVCRLYRLKHLSVSEDATDKNLYDVARCCTELRSLELKSCRNVTVYGLAALCHYAGDRLTTLAIVSFTKVTMDDLVKCIFSCRNLTTLDLRHAFPYSQAMVAAAAAARRDMRARTPLRLDLSSWERDDEWNDFDFDITPWIDVNFCDEEYDYYDSPDEDFDVGSLDSDNDDWEWGE